MQVQNRGARWIHIEPVLHQPINRGALSSDCPSKQIATARAVIDATLTANTDTFPAWTGVPLGADGYVVVKVNRVLPRVQTDKAQTAQRHQQYVQWLSNAEGLAYYEMLKTRYKVQIKAHRPGDGQASTEN